MRTKIQQIQKRNGEIVPFDQRRIERAIAKALQAAGKKGVSERSKVLARMVVQKLAETVAGGIPTVEQVQDVVEQVLQQAGLSNVATLYHQYRQQRALIRKEKCRVLRKSELDEIDKRFDLNALQILATRYLHKDETGAIIETPRQLFERVAIHAVLPSVIFDPALRRKKPGHPFRIERRQLHKWEGKAGIGNFALNRYHLQGLYRIYQRHNAAGWLRYSLEEILELLAKGHLDHYAEEVQTYFDLMTQKKFLPNTPVLANFGTSMGQGMACFVLAIEDSLRAIMETLKQAALIFQSGGGCGYNFSALRPKGDIVRSTGGQSSGPVSFMRLFDTMTDVIKQGGIRRGANMGILNLDHPDIEEFIAVKQQPDVLTNFNLSVLIPEHFWQAYKEKALFSLINPRTGKPVRSMPARDLLQKVVAAAWKSAEPGVLFADNINRYNPLLEVLGPIMATNPCGEVLLYPNESCDLGSVNLWQFVHNGQIQWEALEQTVRTATRFLENVLEINAYPNHRIERQTLLARKIGLGIMGLAEALYELDVPYNSGEGIEYIAHWAETINYFSKLESIQLARERGSFPLFAKSRFTEDFLPIAGYQQPALWHYDWNEVVRQIHRYGIRNTYTTVVAPTGSISMIAGTSSGIEPVYRLVYEKRVSIGNFYYVDPVFERKMEELGVWSETFLRTVAVNGGSIRNFPNIPPEIRRIFVTAYDISPEDHVYALAAVQRWVDSSVSKTVNFPEETTQAEMQKVFLLAHQLGCKGLTVYRSGSRHDVYVPAVPKAGKQWKVYREQKARGQSLYAQEGAPPSEEVSDHGEPRCPVCGSPLIKREGCWQCPTCGWMACQV